MPDITISPEQAAALARGENVTLSPKPTPAVIKHFVIVRKSGVVKSFSEVNGKDSPAVVIRSAPGYTPLGEITHSIWDSSQGDVKIEVKA